MINAQPRPSARIDTVAETDQYVLLTTGVGLIKIEPWADDIFRIAMIETGEFPDPGRFGFLSPKEAPRWRLEQFTDAVEVETARLRLSVDRATGCFTYTTAQGRHLVKEPARDAKTLEKFESFQTVFDDRPVQKKQTADGLKDMIQERQKVFRKHLYHTKQNWEWGDGEALYGLGQHEVGALNLRGSRRHLHQANRRVAIPMLASTRGYGLLFDTASPLIFNDNEHGSYLYGEANEELSYYFIEGPRLDDVIAGYRRLSGRASLLPRWCFRYMQSQERYETQQELLDIVAEYRRRGLPLGSIVLDWLTWNDGHWGQKSFDASRFPNPQALTDELHRQGVRLLISIWPNMDAKTANHAELKARGLLFPQSDLYNAFSEAARQAYWAQANEGLFRHGIDGWWCDSCEPVTPEWMGTVKPEPDKNYEDFHRLARTWMDEESTNAFALWHGRGIDEGQRSSTSEKRVVNLIRSAWTGQQRYGAIVWSGDTSASWATLRDQITAGLNFCASGLPYWTLDIGAFFVKRGESWFWDGEYEAGSADPAYRELYLRWFQFAAFLPVFRAHGTDTRREVWAYGDVGEAVYDSMARFLRLRESLIPYIYALAGMATLSHGTLLRLLAFDFADDPKTHNLGDQFLFGPAFLVCPVTTATGEGPLTRSVYLPSGADWWDYWTGQLHAGGQTLTAPAPLERLPLYVRAGSIIPMQNPDDSAIELVVYPGADGRFTLYQDEGDNFGYESGHWSTIELTWSEHSARLELGDREGSWPGMPTTLSFTVRVVGSEPVVVEYSGARQMLVV